MLNERSLEELSITDLCREVGATTGAFYNQFDSKSAFFSAIQRDVCELRKKDFSDFMEDVRASQLEPSAMLAKLVRNFVDHMRTDGGVIRASLLHVRTGEDWWAPFRELGVFHKKLLGEWLLPRLTHIKPSQRSTSIEFAHQALAGTIVHTILNRPGTLGVHDEAFVREVIALVQRYLELPPAR